MTVLQAVLSAAMGVAVTTFALASALIAFALAEDVRRKWRERRRRGGAA